MLAFFHISWFKIFIISYGGYLERENNIILIPFFYCVCITYWDLTIFRYLCLFKGFSFNMCLFKGFLFNICASSGASYIICVSFRAIDLSILNWLVIFLWPFLECQVFLGFSSSRELHRLSRQVYHASGVSYIHLLTILQGHQSVLEYLQPGYMTLSLSLYQWVHLVIDLQDFSNDNHLNF